jgi:hypothetical protein
MTNMGQRPISLRILQPVPNSQYTIEVALLSPGPTDVPVSVFYEPVKQSGAIMTAYPSRLVLDGDRGTAQSVMIRMAEASGQQSLSGVTATLGSLDRWGGGPSLVTTSPATQQLPDLPAAEQQYVAWEVPCPPDAVRGKYVGLATLHSVQTADLQVPVVAIVRRATETVSVYEGPDEATSVVQKSLTLGPDGTAETWVHVPSGFRVVYAAMGLVGASSNVQNPLLDIGANDSPEWAFSGTFDLGVLVDHIEDAFNSYLSTHTPMTEGIDVPIRVVANAGETLLLNGIQLFLENDLPGDFNLDRDVDAADLAVFVACASGPIIPYAGDCGKADFDGDNDVDQSDFGIFQRCLSGENNPADPNCAN